MPTYAEYIATIKAVVIAAQVKPGESGPVKYATAPEGYDVTYDGNQDITVKKDGVVQDASNYSEAEIKLLLGIPS